MCVGTHAYYTLAPLCRRLAALFRDLPPKRLVLRILHRYICCTHVCIRHNSCIHIHMCTCMYACMYACMHAFMYVCACVWTYVCM